MDMVVDQEEDVDVVKQWHFRGISKCKNLNHSTTTATTAARDPSGWC